LTRETGIISRTVFYPDPIFDGCATSGDDGRPWPELRALSSSLLFNELLGVQRGRPAETWDRLQRTGEILRARDAAHQNLSKEDIAEKLEINVRTLSTWHDDCGLTWIEWLRASENAALVKPSEAEGI
jgi:hypothetical protein